MVDCPHPGPARGAYASSRTWAGDAMDADARNDEARGADGEIVWSRSSDAGIKSCGTFRRTTAANKPGTPRRSRISRNPLRRECRCFGGTCVACVRRVHTFLHARLAGAASIRHSLRPLHLRGPRMKHHSGIRVAGMLSHVLSAVVFRLTGEPSTPRLLGSIRAASGILDRPVKPGDDTVV
jgi:hypothetical protein